MTCLITTRVSGPCSDCGDTANPAHVDDAPQKWLRCAKCCREHAALSIDWESRGEACGEQQGLFEGAMVLMDQEVSPQ